MDKKKHKINRYETYDLANLQDALALLAANVEDAYKVCGIENYTQQDCFSAAVQILKAHHSSSRDTTIGTEFRSGYKDD